MLAWPSESFGWQLRKCSVCSGFQMDDNQRDMVVLECQDSGRFLCAGQMLPVCSSNDHTAACKSPAALLQVTSDLHTILLHSC